MATPGVALQIYTVRDLTSRDYRGTIRAIAALGYPAIQLGETGGLSAQEQRAFLDDLGLQVAGMHSTARWAQFAEQLDAEIAYCLGLGIRDLVCPTIPESLRHAADDYRRGADLLNTLGARCRSAGIRLSYHNHAFEFEQFGGQSALDLLLTSTDPTLVYFEPDVYWIKRGGEDPATYLRRYAGRCPLIHLKDMAADSAQSFAEVGEGVLDFPAIFAAAEDGGAEWYVVEQDRCNRPSLESARISLEHLRDWGKV